VGVTYQSGVGLSSSVSIGAHSPGATFTPGGEAYVPADVGTADFWSRDTKVSVEGKATAGFGPFGGLSGTLALEQQPDRYGIRCGPWTPVLKGEAGLGVCADAQVKGDIGKMGASRQVRRDRSARRRRQHEAEFMVWSAREPITSAAMAGPGRRAMKVSSPGDRRP
jgi:hypothetical protein